MPFTIAIRPLLTNVFACVVSVSKEPPVMSNTDAMAFSNSTWLRNCSSCNFASSPARFFTLSRLVSMSFNVRIYCNPASSPGPPKMSAKAVPTSDDDAGNSASFSDTCFMTSNVVMLPSAKFRITSSEEMPIPSSASRVAVVISRMRKLPSFMTSMPLSE